MNNLKKKIEILNGKNFGQLGRLKGVYVFENYLLNIVHTQGSPGAHPASICEVKIDVGLTGLSKYINEVNRLALEDFLLRRFDVGIKKIAKQNRGEGGSGSFHTIYFGQKILKRNALIFEDNFLKFRFILSFPSSGSKGGIFNYEQAKIMLFDELPKIINFSFFVKNYDDLCVDKMEKHLKTFEIQSHIRDYMKKNGLIVFIANDSILPRKSGVSDLPDTNDEVKKFKSPKESEITIDLQNGDSISGMGIYEGVTIITGGGFHGKSTILEAVSNCVYNHINGDGREYCLTREDAVYINTEPGRSIRQVDISPFIKDLPNNKNTKTFTTDNASGSTSQATNIIEAIESGSKLLLFDEDMCATNFMIQDDIISKFIDRDNEPIRPLFNVVRTLWEKYGISSIFVVGGLGNFLKKADTVIMMKEYEAYNITEKVRLELGDVEKDEEDLKLPEFSKRKLQKDNFDPSYTNKRMNKTEEKRIKALRENFRRLEYGSDLIDLESASQLVEAPQTETIGEMIYALKDKFEKSDENKFDLLTNINELFSEIDEFGLDLLPHKYLGLLSMPRKFELMSAINRMRSLKLYKGVING